MTSGKSISYFEQWLAPAPQLYLIDKGTLLVQKTRGYGPIYHDYGGKYNDMRERGCNDAIHAFIEALDEFLPFEEYGHLYEKNNPDSWGEDLHMWFDFNIFQEIKVLVRFEYADHKEVSWTAVRNDLDDYVDRVEYIKLLDLDSERVETEVSDE
ncbi:hypothetical protein FOVSG1_011388 [Fusarium oxysporum f. sp. vasinfectum]